MRRLARAHCRPGGIAGYHSRKSFSAEPICDPPRPHRYRQRGDELLRRTLHDLSATARENLHGHNFRLGCLVTAPVGDDGLCFDYAIIKRKLRSCCDGLDERMLLPSRSPHLRLEQDEHEVRAYYAAEVLRFLVRDVIVLPIANITVEALSQHFLDLLLSDPEFSALPIHALAVRVSSGSGQWGESLWERA